MKAGMIRVTGQPVFLAVLAALHFIAAPCAMAMTAASEQPCEHCDAGRDMAPCAATPTDPGNDDGAAAPGRYRLPDPPAAAVLPSPPVLPPAAGLSGRVPAPGAGSETGRYAGDPPLNVLYGKFLN